MKDLLTRALVGSVGSVLTFDTGDATNVCRTHSEVRVKK